MHSSPKRGMLIRTASYNSSSSSSSSNNNYTNKSSSSSSRLMGPLPRLWRLTMVVVVTPRGLALAGKRRTFPPPYGARSARRNRSNTVRHLADVLVKGFLSVSATRSEYCSACHSVPRYIRIVCTGKHCNMQIALTSWGIVGRRYLLVVNSPPVLCFKNQHLRRHSRFTTYWYIVVDGLPYRRVICI